jgi:fatty acid amide hydrolase
MGAVQIRDAIKRGELSASEATAAFIERIEETHDDLNAVIYPLFESAMARARAADGSDSREGLLFGVPMTIKDNFMVRGTPTSCGLAHRSDQILGDEGPLISRLRREGAIFLGKTSLPQLLVSHECDHARYGPAKNPWDHSRTPGGSSGGEGAVIAARGSPLGLGSDMGGSIRVPTHCCGIVGLKPTNTRFPNDDTPLADGWFAGFFGFEGFMNQPGPMARRVDDLKLAMDALLGEPLGTGEWSPPVGWRQGPIDDADGLRVGVYTDNGFFTASPALQRIAREAGEALAAEGLVVREFDPPDPAYGIEVGLKQLGSDGGAWAKEALAGEPPVTDIKNLMRVTGLPNALRRPMAALLRIKGQHHAARGVASSGPRTAREYWALCAERTLYRARFVRAMIEQEVDVLVCPPYGLPAPLIGANRNGAATLAASHSALFNVIGLPAGVVSIGRVRQGEESDRLPSGDQVELDAAESEAGSAGLPVGVQVAGRHWREDHVLSVMKKLETLFEDSPDFPRMA